MFDKDILDNLKGQEIKELIVAKKIKLEELDTSALEKLLDYETDMLCLDMGDMELIRACAARLDELNGPVMTDEEFWSIINKAEERMVSGEQEITPVDVPVNAPARVVKKRTNLKKVWLVAAIVVLLISAATMTATAFGFNIFDYFKQVINLPVGGRVDQEGITFINSGKMETFSSIDNLLTAKELDIMYPAVLPEKVCIKQVIVNEGANDSIGIQFIMNDPSLIVAIDTNAKPFEATGYKQCITKNSCKYYVFSDNGFYATCYYKNDYYYIGSDSYENLILIIENMREIK